MRRRNVDPRNTGGRAARMLVRAGQQLHAGRRRRSLQPKVSLKYQLDKDAQVYASWGRGFRSGLTIHGTSTWPPGAGRSAWSDVLPSEFDGFLRDRLQESNGSTIACA